MAKQERTRKSAPQNKVKSFQADSESIEPWSELDEKGLAVFNALVASREIDTWSDADRISATMLAKIQVEWEREFALLQQEGATIYTDKGWPGSNPRIQVVGQLNAQYLKFLNGLGLSASQRGISGNKQAKRNQQDRKAAAPNTSDKIASLIARPND